MRVWQTLADLLQGYGRCAMVTVAEVKGSAPREEGARLFVVEGGGYRGTIGGGALEWRALAEAQEALGRGGAAKVVRMVLGPDLGQCCGGQVKLLVETWCADDLPVVREMAMREGAGSFATATVIVGDEVHRSLTNEPGPGPAVRFLSGNSLIERFGHSPRQIYLFGAGHVGRALMLALAPLPFRVRWIDSRSDAFPAAVPANLSVLHAEHPAAIVEQAPPAAFVVVMTHSHAMDLAIVAAALAIGHIPYVGLIGSDTKRARFMARLRSAGIAENELGRFHCPIGLAGIRSKLPAVIAASTAADLVARDEQFEASLNSPILVHMTA